MASKYFFDSTLMETAEQPFDFIGDILESSTDYSVIGTDLNGIILFWNDSARRLYGYGPGEVVGIAKSAILHTLEDVQAGKPQEILQTALRDGKWEGTIDCLRKSGQQFAARVVITSRRDRSGRANGFLHISKDISDDFHLTEPARAQTQLAEERAHQGAAESVRRNAPMGTVTRYIIRR